ncbi:hypothetical protein HYDPIDRAFT_24673 [Hydnomerulius pinastri MD-312]|nr:hypothetical protein HYDPIDRAFT_24673 [Hydnomerulius pinastri MD-312]
MVHDMDHQVQTSSDSLEELYALRDTPPPSRSQSAPQRGGKGIPLRIIVPPSEYCPFSTDFTLPITPLSLPTPVSSSCFMFSDSEEQSASAPPTPGLILTSSPDDAAVVDFASPTSSQFLLMPPTPHSTDICNEAAISASPLNTPSAVDGQKVRFPLGESKDTKFGNPRPWEVTSSTWLSDLGGNTETDRIFRRNLHDTTSVDTDSSPVSTPSLSLSPVSPPSPLPSPLAYTLPMSLDSAPVSSPFAPSSLAMSPQLNCNSPTRLALQPTGTATFPSTVDSLQAWREGVMFGVSQAQEPHPFTAEDDLSPTSPGVHSAELVEPEPEATVHPSFSVERRSRRPPLHTSKSQNFITRAKKLGGRMKQFVARHRANKYNGGMDRGVRFRIVTSQDSENGSVILISAPPPPYDARPLTPIPPRSPEEREILMARSRTVSEYSSRLPGSTLERATTGVTDSSSRQGGSSRNPLRRLSLAAFTTIKAF